jgi:hypothetical protein
MSPLINQARQALADACNTVPGITVLPRPTRTPVTGDGWVIVTRAKPLSFNTISVDFTVIIIMGHDGEAADIKIDQWLGPLLRAVTEGVLCSNVVIEGTAISVGQAPLHALTITATMEAQ